LYALVGQTENLILSTSTAQLRKLRTYLNYRAMMSGLRTAIFKISLDQDTIPVLLPVLTTSFLTNYLHVGSILLK